MKTILAVLILILINTQLYSQSKKSMIKKFNQYYEVTCNECSITVDNNLMAQINCSDSQYVFSLCDVVQISTSFDNSSEKNVFILNDGTSYPAVCVPINGLDKINSFMKPTTEDDIIMQFGILKSKYCNK